MSNKLTNYEIEMNFFNDCVAKCQIGFTTKIIVELKKIIINIKMFRIKELKEERDVLMSKISTNTRQAVTSSNWLDIRLKKVMYIHVITTECPKIFPQICTASVINIPKICTQADAVQICGNFWDTQYIYWRIKKS